MFSRFKSKINIKYFMLGYLSLILLYSSLYPAPSCSQQWCGIYFGNWGQLWRGALAVAVYAIFDLSWTYLRDKIWYVPVSSWISGLVLSIVSIAALPKASLIFIVLFPFCAVVSKQLLHFGKNRHVFNPASFAMALVAIFTPAISWWAVANSQPGTGLFLIITLGGLFILWRQNRWQTTVPFLFSYAIFLALFSITMNGVAISDALKLILPQVVNGITFFFASVMLIEPITSSFSTGRQRIFYGIIVGFAAVVITGLARIFNWPNQDPLVLGLLCGNLLASLLFLPGRSSLAISPRHRHSGTPLHSGGGRDRVRGGSRQSANPPLPRRGRGVLPEISYWFRAVPEQKKYSTLKKNLRVDAVVVGGGMAGLSAAYFLSKAGIKTVLLEAGNIGTGDSGFTTAMATRILESTAATIKAWDASEAGINLLRQTIENEKINCDWEAVDGIGFTLKKDLQKFAQTVKTLQTKNSSVEYLDQAAATATIGAPASAAYRLPGSEGQFHIRKFLRGLAERAIKNGAMIFENSEVVDFQPGKQVVVKTVAGSVTADWLVVATGQPSAKFFPEVASHLSGAVSYVIDIKFSKKQPLARALLWDDLDPYHYLRWVGDDELILGGEDWLMKEKKPATDPHLQLENWFRKFYGGRGEFKIVNKWQGTVLYTPDIIPYISPHPAYGKNIIFLTGWGGNGMTQGFLAGNIAADMIQKKENQFQKLFSF